MRQLPEDPADFDKAIAPCSVLVRPVIHGISKLSLSLGSEPLDSDEVRSGVVAWSALMYQYGATLDARVLVALWSAGILIPRLVTHFERQREKQETKKAAPERRPLQLAVPPAPKPPDFAAQASAVIGDKLPGDYARPEGPPP